MKRYTDLSASLYPAKDFLIMCTPQCRDVLFCPLLYYGVPFRFYGGIFYEPPGVIWQLSLSRAPKSP